MAVALIRALGSDAPASSPYTTDHASRAVCVGHDGQPRAGPRGVIAMADDAVKACWARRRDDARRCTRITYRGPSAPAWAAGSGNMRFPAGDRAITAVEDERRGDARPTCRLDRAAE